MPLSGWFFPLLCCIASERNIRAQFYLLNIKINTKIAPCVLQKLVNSFKPLDNNYSPQNVQEEHGYCLQPMVVTTVYQKCNTGSSKQQEDETAHINQQLPTKI